jgi:GntR family transcriptional regulator, transcriptional repressor for pyruvate dehydrogenase complex
MTASRDLRILRPRGTLTDEVTEVLVRLVRSGERRAGARLPSEKEMSERFGVSRTVIREAVSRLKSEGLVEAHQGKGAFVRAAGPDVPFRIARRGADSVSSILQIVELRTGIEAEAAALAAERRTGAELRAIERALRTLDRCAGGEEGVEADQAFHRAIARATGNPHYVALWDFIGRFLTRAMRVTRAYEARHAELVTQVKREHEALARAIARRDPEAARSAARQHLEMVATRITAADPSFRAREARRRRSPRP